MRLVRFVAMLFLILGGVMRAGGGGGGGGRLRIVLRLISS